MFKLWICVSHAIWMVVIWIYSPDYIIASIMSAISSMSTTYVANGSITTATILFLMPFAIPAGAVWVSRLLGPGWELPVIIAMIIVTITVYDIMVVK